MNDEPRRIIGKFVREGLRRAGIHSPSEDLIDTWVDKIIERGGLDIVAEDQRLSERNRLVVQALRDR